METPALPANAWRLLASRPRSFASSYARTFSIGTTFPEDDGVRTSPTFGVEPSGRDTASFFNGFAVSFAAFDVVAARLFAPLTGVRSVKIQPTPCTGLPPMSRPSSKSQGWSPWNSWNESFERTTAPWRWAIFKIKTSPRPIVPAGGATTSPWSSASLRRGRSLASILCSNVASTTIMSVASGCSSS